MEKTVDKKNDWRVNTINLRFLTYGEDKGSYTGTIEFMNGEDESFKFNITPKMANTYIKLISKDIVSSASLLGDRLVESLKSQGLIDK